MTKISNPEFARVFVLWYIKINNKIYLKYMKIILATTSPYRKEIFESLGLSFEAEGSNVDESQIKRNNPEELVRELSKLKAEAVAKNYSDSIVIGFDSVGFFNGNILEKPKTKEEAFIRLISLSGKKHYHYTGIHMINTISGKIITRVNKNTIFMREYLSKEVETYLDRDERFITYALGYDTEKHISASFIERIEGNHLNLKGIPLSDVIEMLNEIEYKK